MHILFLVLFFAIVLGVFFAVRWLFKHPMRFGNLGRIASTIVLAGGTLLDQLNLLPWGTILSDVEAKMVGFALAVGMMILHVIDMAKDQLNPPTPPTEGK